MLGHRRVSLPVDNRFINYSTRRDIHICFLSQSVPRLVQVTSLMVVYKGMALFTVQRTTLSVTMDMYFMVIISSHA